MLKVGTSFLIVGVIVIVILIVAKMPRDKVCAAFFEKFPSERKDARSNGDRVGFMLAHPAIRSKLVEWVEGGGQKGPLFGKKKLTNVNNQFIDANDDADGLEAQREGSRSALELKNADGSITNRTNVSSVHQKNSNHSMKQKELGNTLFKQGKLHESLEAYNQSILFAPTFNENGTHSNSNSEKENAELLSLSLANRSAVYFELGENFYQDSLRDADIAIKCGYPDRLKCKLLLRKANIYVKTKQWGRAESIIHQIRESLQTHPLHQDGLSTLDELEVKVQENYRNNGNSDVDNEELAQRESNRSIKFEENPLFENASIDLRLCHSKTSERFIVASKDLQKRDVIFCETPFASVLLPHFYNSHCHNCHKMLNNFYFIPCRNCSQVKFCSETCDQEAWKAYHQFECLNLDLLHSIGIAHLAIRIILCAGLQNIIRAVKKHEYLSNSQNISIFQKGERNYDRVYSLLDHLDEMNLEDQFQYTLSAALLTYWLDKKTTFLLDSECETPLEVLGKSSSVQEVVGGTLLRHICQLICNAHAITDILSDVNVNCLALSTAEESQLRIATAIYPAVSMLNHNCDPNIAATFKDGKTLFVKLTRDVTQGQEVFNCYGPHWRRMSVTERQDCLLQQYFFVCQCAKCNQELDSKTSFVESFCSFKCEKCGGPVPSPKPEDKPGFMRTCANCGHMMDTQNHFMAFMYTNRMFQDGEILLSRGKIEDALKVFKSCRDQYCVHLYPTHASLGNLEDVIGKCYADLGNFPKAAESVKKSLEYVGKRFGEESIEYGRELKKYLELLARCPISDQDEFDRLTLQYKSILLDY